MKWSTEKPKEPGYYWIAEAGEKPHAVLVEIESDSHSMLFVLLPGDKEKYPLEIWNGALWMGPVPMPE